MIPVKPLYATPARPLVLIHGYSDKGESFNNWKAALKTKLGYQDSNFHICSYASLANEISIKDIAEGFDRALRIQAGLDEEEEFDAIVHSTGMLVLRSWLTTYAKRYGRLKHLIALAPATNGSPLAHKGRSWMAAMFKGNRQFGPDFMETGDLILDGLELGSRFTWELAHQDVIGPSPPFGNGPDSPYVFTFCGDSGYTGMSSVVNAPGTDGTVRWAGCALNSRKVIMDLTDYPPEGKRIRVEEWCNLKIPLIPATGLNHGSILSSPTDALVDQVARALTVCSEDEFNAWLTAVEAETAEKTAAMGRWQQFVIRAVDDRGDPITEYNFQLYVKEQKEAVAAASGGGGDGGGGTEKQLNFPMDVHTYAGDKSLRCFHVQLDQLKLGGELIEPGSITDGLFLRIMASSGSEKVGYSGFGGSEDGWAAELDISELLTAKGARFFYPFTTTLLEIRLSRDPLPLVGKNNVLWFTEDTA